MADSSTVTVDSAESSEEVRIGTWMKDLLPRVPGAVRKIVRRELALACREFYVETCAWHALIGPKNMKANRPRYALSPYDDHSNVIRVLSVEYSGSPLMVYPRKPVQGSSTGDSPSSYYLEGVDNVILYPTPTLAKADALTFYVALAPKLDSDYLPKIALTHHYDAILDGTLGRLMSHPAKPYSNATLGMYHLQRFRAAIGSFAALGRQGNATGQAWYYPRFT